MQEVVRCLSCIAVSATCSLAFGGQIEQVKLTGTPQMQLVHGAPASCGYGFIGVTVTAATSERMEAIDALVNIYASGLVLVKAGLRTTNLTALAAREQPGVRPITNFWLKVGGKSATTPDAQGVQFSDSPKGDVFYGTGAEGVLALFAAVAAKEPIMFGVSPANDAERIYSGVVKVSDVEVKLVTDCVTELIAGMQKRLEQAARK